MLYLPLPKAHISSPSTAAVLDLAAQGPGWRKLRNTSSMCHGRWNDRKDRCLPYYNRPTQDGLRGHFVLRAIGKRFRKDRTAGCEKVVGIRFALDSSLEGTGFELLVPRREARDSEASRNNCARRLPDR